ncbi:MAG: hypothetical protein D8M58_01055 [Calditrichaeota bacterium]|nr:MAG: hypothetical protein DWQ03_06025 [Calditrichota bacterium]MBL1203956.1 hypothetical protein [Calditrichota bacterium]NOG43787.1 hypothetical protein [Calditrichota bacterium]
MIELIFEIIGIILLVIFLTKVVDPIFRELFKNAFDFEVFKPTKRDKLFIKWIEKRKNVFVYVFTIFYIIILIIEFITDDA